MLLFLHNRIERISAVTAAGVCTSLLANSKTFVFRLTTKILLYSLKGYLCIFGVTLSSENTHTRK